MENRSKPSREMVLSALPHGEKGRIVRIVPSHFAVRLLEVGCLPGAEVERYAELGGGDRIAIEVNRVIIALRREEADTIIVEAYGAA